MTIAVDFDGTITEQNLYPDIGPFRKYAINVLKALQRKGHTVCLWTCRSGESLDLALLNLKKKGFTPDYVNEGSLNTLNKDSKYNYKGKIVPIGNRMQEIRKAQNAGKLDEIDKQFLNSLGMVFYVKAIRVLEIFCEKNNCTLSSLPKNQIIVIDGHKYDIKTILNNLNANHPEGEGLTEQELDVLAKLGIKWKTIKNKDETTLSV